MSYKIVLGVAEAKKDELLIQLFEADVEFSNGFSSSKQTSDCQKISLCAYFNPL